MRAALVKWRKAPHDVILLDLHMPVLDGFGLAKAIRHEEAKRGLPRTALVAVTADAMKGKDARCYAAGMDGFVTKPVSIDALARTLGRWVPNLVAMPAPGRTPNGALFDPKALRALFGSDASKLAGHVQNFADSVKRDIAALHAAPDAKQVAAFAHRLRGAAGARGRRSWLSRRRASKQRPRATTLRAPAARLSAWRSFWPTRWRRCAQSLDGTNMYPIPRTLRMASG